MSERYRRIQADNIGCPDCGKPLSLHGFSVNRPSFLCNNPKCWEPKLEEWKKKGCQGSMVSFGVEEWWGEWLKVECDLGDEHKIPVIKNLDFPRWNEQGREIDHEVRVAILDIPDQEDDAR